MNPGLPDAGLREFVLWTLRQRRRVRITGESMEPTLHADEVIFVDVRAYLSTSPAPGDVVVARHPQQPSIEIVKRVEFTDGGVYLRSDNVDATNAADSRRFGLVPLDHVVGRVSSKIAQR
jgi:nickel-type superoxide dismutase maturation protease